MKNNKLFVLINIKYYILNIFTLNTFNLKGP